MIRARRVILSAFTLALLATQPKAGEGWISDFIPDFARLQYAGQSGLFAFGIGYSWWGRKFEASVHYGYAPQMVAEQPIHTLSERNAISLPAIHLPQGFNVIPFMTGITANISLGDRFQLYLPKSDDAYYWPDALYFWLFTGVKIDQLLGGRFFLKQISYQLEIGTINQYLQIYLGNRSIGLRDILSLSLSTQIYL